MFRSVLSIIELYLELAVFLFIALPFVFKYTPWIQRHLVFLPFVRYDHITITQRVEPKALHMGSLKSRFAPDLGWTQMMANPHGEQPQMVANPKW